MVADNSYNLKHSCIQTKEERLALCWDRLRKIQEPKWRKYELWPGYFDLRSTEIQAILDNCSLPLGGTWLEIGAGIGFLSWVLTPLSDRMIITDLDQIDKKTHTPGIERAVQFINTVGNAGIEIIKASAIDLSIFPDHSVRVLINAWVLEHIRECDRKQVLAEFQRVLEPNGICLSIVPSFMERVTQPPAAAIKFFQEIIKFTLIPFFRPNTFQRMSKSEYGNRRSILLYIRRCWVSNIRPIQAYFQPHGEYRNSFEELYANFPQKWIKKFETAGFKVVDFFCPMLFPFHLFYGFSSHLSAHFAKSSFKLWKPLCRIPGIRCLGTGVAICARPKS